MSAVLEQIAASIGREVTTADVLRLLNELDDAGRNEVDQLIASGSLPVWVPQPGPQTAAYNSPADVLFYGGSAGGGKGQPLDAPVLTPFGFRPMGSIKVGSVVSTPDGSASQVIGVYPLGERQLYRFTFHDGTSTEVTDDHIWLAWKASGHGERRLWTTAQLVKAHARGGRFCFPVTEPVQFTDQARYPRRPVDPYLLGVLLGDGSITDKALRITTADPEIIERIARLTGVAMLGPYKYAGRTAEYRLPEPNDARQHLEKWGLVGANSFTKFIPPAYLLGSVAERWELLRGLMDTDGWADADGDTYYCTVSARLRDDVAALARSLGALVTIRSKMARCQNGNGSLAYTLRIKLPKPALAFSLPRKLAVCADKVPQSMARRLVSIEQTRTAPAQCIKVANPNGLYLTDGYIVTHNTDLLLGLSLTSQQHTIIFRRQSVQLVGIEERMTKILGTRDGYNSQDGIWRLPGDKVLELGSVKEPGDWIKYQGRPHDAKLFDEICHFTELQFRALIGWLRTDNPEIRQRVVCAGNPPTDAEGEWVKRYWAAWLDPKHPNPAKPGELRWYITNNKGEDEEVGGPELVKMADGTMTTPKSRTFIPSSVEDNAFLLSTGYKATLQALPEPLRSKMLNGDFNAGADDPAWQTIPTEWVEAAMSRWQPRDVKGDMTAIGFDPARGGQDKSSLARRHGAWFDEIVTAPGVVTKDGPTAAAWVVPYVRDGAPIATDSIGIGSSALDFLIGLNLHVHAVNAAEGVSTMTKAGGLRFRNRRAEMYWRMREALDPAAKEPIALPPDSELKSDLCAVRYKVVTMGKLAGIQMISKDDIRETIGRSPDKGDSVAMTFVANLPEPRGIASPSGEYEEPEAPDWRL